MKSPFNKPFIIGKELFYIAQAVESGAISGDGIFTKRCHQWLEQHLHCEKALLTHSCTAALEMAAILCNVGPGDEVILPSYTFVSTANAFAMRGARLVFVDVLADTFNIDVERIKAAITPATKAIVVVHYAGVPCDMDRIMDLASQHNLWVIEDAAQAILTQDEHGRFLGTIGHLGCLSFHETKNIIAGEGGALLINDRSLIERAEIIREKGTNRSQFFRGEIDKYTWVDIGSSYLPSDLIAAFLYGQLEQAPTIIEHRQALWEAYYEGLADLEHTGRLQRPPHKGNGHIFYLVLPSLSERSALIQHLKALGIHAVFHYVPLHSSPGGLKYGEPRGTMINTDRAGECLLRLPMYYELSLDDVGTIVQFIHAFYSE